MKSKLSTSMSSTVFAITSDLIENLYMAIGSDLYTSVCLVETPSSPSFLGSSFLPSLPSFNSPFLLPSLAAVSVRGN